ncbi:uncharacterized protein EDB91DRAFT_1243486 [Suillus paluster]|uniref:uncharacterized protein n=1 Tax=Suillus paluster TaxID=48578 RepID=UPI001B860F93|nr:uncharacterized protein EDB91DRAFT_1243486 [Suillus paluster]KAG1752720.1 hypothetical protein EDB91DRAFT_1243486 [Suillus paluster]
MSAPKLASRVSSYRKPVPKFIPSPPASPRGSPTSSANRLSFSHASANSDAPPLPPDWRDVIDRAVSRDRRTTPTLPAIDTVVDSSSHDAHGADTEFSAERLSPSTTDLGTSGTMTFTPPTPTESYHDDELVSRPTSPTPWEHQVRSTAKWLPSYQEVRVIFKYFPIESSYSRLYRNTAHQRPHSLTSAKDPDQLNRDVTRQQPTIISQLAPHSTLPLASRDPEHGAAISLERSEPPPLPPKPSSLPTPPASLLTHGISSPPYHAGHDKSSHTTYSPGHDRRPSTLNSTLNFTINSDKCTSYEGNAPSTRGLVTKIEASGNASEFSPIHAGQDMAIRTKRGWWHSVASGFKRFMSSLCCL